MHIVRYVLDGKEYYGEIAGSEISVIEGDVFGEFEVTRRRVPAASVRLLPPVNPGKIMAIGLNYRDHSREIGISIPDEPLMFLKAPTSIVGHEDTIILPSERRTDYEGELAIIIKERAKNVEEKDVNRHILGYTCLNDVSDRVLQQKDSQWARAKSMDTFCPVGPCIATGIDASDLALQTRLNGTTKQSSRTSEMAFSPVYLVSFLSRYMTLMPGDIIATGTPGGVGPLNDGDIVEVTIEGIGTLRNPVKRAY
ncbi:MAG: fumarylacetoacetate hydrolase family protein [Ignavibacteriales bacterium]